MNIKDILRTLLPDGTASLYLLLRMKAGASPDDDEEEFFAGGTGAADDWSYCPAWPPDVFAVAATIIDRSSCFTLAGHTRSDISQHIEYFKSIESGAKAWVDLSSIPPLIGELWQKIAGDFLSTEMDEVCKYPELVDALFLLFAIADEACKGMGWRIVSDPAAPAVPAGSYAFTDLAMASMSADEQNYSAASLPYMPSSLCSLVPANVAIVLPKSMTAGVGCSIRSLSHHLALLPGTGQVLPSWHLVDKLYSTDEKIDSVLKLLVVPFPFHIPETSFRLGTEPQQLNGDERTAAFFTLQQKWLDRGSRNQPLSAVDLVRHLLVPLLEQARKESPGEVHGILMPECALSEKLADEVAELLAYHKVDFFITGVLKKGNDGKMRNVAQTHVLVPNGSTVAHVTYEQSKHHRWRLDPSQVERYALSFTGEYALKERAPTQWWEEIDVSQRCLPFYAIRRDMSLAVLICEDLARSDPAMPVIRAVGPNLVVALLMDGPQLAVRWPGRYATVRADDPGSSVLTVTCAGLVDRANWLESRPVRSIGLWRDASGRTQELNLPHDCQGMFLTLKAKKETQYTLDNRSDSDSTRLLRLMSAIPLALPKVPNWL